MRVRFGEFVLDSDERQLTRNGEVLHLTGKAFQLLVLLVAERPRVVAKKEIYDALWPDVFVQEANIKNLIAELRDALPEEMIRTDRGTGYAFTPDVEDELAIRAPRYLLVVNGVASPLVEGRNIIGRDAEAHVRLDHAAVSRRHASITITGEDAILHDMGSRNGTFLNGEKLEAARPLRAGDEIRIAQFAMRFQTAPGTLRATAPLGYRL